MKSKHIAVVFILVTFFSSCTKENTETYIRDVVNEWNVAVSSRNILPADPSYKDTGNIHFLLMSDTSLVFELVIKNITGNDKLATLKLKAGDAVTNGRVLIDLTPFTKFQGTLGSNTYAYGAYTNIRQTLADSLMNTGVQLYLELTSQKHPDGYARGQMNERIVLSADVDMEGRFVVPSVSTAADATAWLRLTSGKKLYSRITTGGNEPGDPMKTAAIQRAAFGQNGPVVFTLAESIGDFNRSKVFTLSDAIHGMLINDSRLYLTAGSTQFPAGKIRGQLRN